MLHRRHRGGETRSLSTRQPGGRCRPQWIDSCHDQHRHDEEYEGRITPGESRTTISEQLEQGDDHIGDAEEQHGQADLPPSPASPTIGLRPFWVSRCYLSAIRRRIQPVQEIEHAG